MATENISIMNLLIEVYGWSIQALILDADYVDAC